MATPRVPEHAANMFMNITGFEPYFREQHEVLLTEDRQLDGISGIRTPNDSTVVFSLVEPDETFLNDLATPYAVIYPQESAQANRFQAVGTGPFKLSQKRSDSLYIFAQFKDYRIQDQPQLSRVDITSSSTEKVLLDAMNSGEIQLIPHLGPQQLQMTLSSNSQLSDNLTGNYNLFNKGTLSFFLRYNETADLPKNQVAAALASVEQSNLFSNLPADSFDLVWSLSSSNNAAMPDSISSTFTNEPFVKQFYSQLSRQLSEEGVSFSMSRSHISNREIPLYIDSHFQVLDAQMTTTPPSTLVALTIKSQALARNSVNNMDFNNFPWWIDLREVSVPKANNR